ncbi:MAG: preprotein translocase subunit YajC [Myxococcota bacterium]
MLGQPPVHLLFAAQEGGQGGSGGFDPGLLLPIILFAILYFVWLRPAAKDRKKQHDLIQSLKRGDEIITQQGLFGTVSDLQETTLTLEVARNVKVKMLRTAVLRKVPPPSEGADKSKEKKSGS